MMLIEFCSRSATKHYITVCKYLFEVDNKDNRTIFANVALALLSLTWRRYLQIALQYYIFPKLTTETVQKSDHILL